MPTKRYTNGSGKLDIYLIDAVGNTEHLNFSFRYQALNEYDNGVATVHMFYNGDEEKLLHFAKLKWELDYSGLLDEDQPLINKLKNAEFEGRKIVLVPHNDTPWRAYEVYIIENQERKLGQYYNNNQTGANKDYVLWFAAKKALTRYDWIDPVAVPFVTGYLARPLIVVAV